MNAMTAERIGRNDSAFRDANEQIRGKVREQDIADDQLIPFICECADEACTTIIQLDLAEYEDIRTDSRQFLNVIGHERAEGPIEVMSKPTTISWYGTRVGLERLPNRWTRGATSIERARQAR